MSENPPPTTPPQPPTQPRSRRPPTNPASSPSPFVFPPLSQPNPSTTSLMPNTAEGRPIPLDDSTAAHRTSALRELNRSQPSSRRRYTKSSAPPSITSTTTGTYSQPVLVRTYSRPAPSSSSARTRPTSRRVPLSVVSLPSNTSSWRPGQDGMALGTTRQKGKKKMPPSDDAMLPPLEAFTFKSIMADMQQDIGAHLDQIAEICARSRYSLSNQYEVHVVPHGSGSGFLASLASTGLPLPSGPTLQAIPSDDEHAGTRHTKRHSAARPRSAAYGTLETIMSSSRSSDEDKSKRKSAAEIAAGVRGRMADTGQDEDGSANSTEAQASNESQNKRPRPTLFATSIIDSSRNLVRGESNPPSFSLIGEPAKPETSRSHLMDRTLAESAFTESYTQMSPPQQPSPAVLSGSVAAAAIASSEEPRSQSGLLSGLNSWISRRGVTPSTIPKGSRSKSYAEGTLRDLLRAAEITSNQKNRDINQAV
ncbi:hypothetical protein F5X99DRAFT_393254 [Biscogniauxia marginata]|nr:hypothetical protein F5X99DRAFT_393254 [Biscogniauxia marginata]